jgi:hypothetical protein
MTAEKTTAARRYRHIAHCGRRWLLHHSHAVVLFGQETVSLSPGTPGPSPAPEATLERGAPRDNQAKTENEMALDSSIEGVEFRRGLQYSVGHSAVTSALS